MIPTSYQSPCSSKARDAPAGFVEVRVDLCITEPDVARAFTSGEKSLTRDAGHADRVEDMHGSIFSVPAWEPRRVGQHIIRTLWDGGRQTSLGQGCAKPIALLLVVLRQLPIERLRQFLNARRDPGL
jgi:hypothetical protein